MPENPFGGIGNRGDARSMKAASRAVRSYSAELRRLAGMESKAASAAEARSQAATRAINQQNKAIDRTSSLLDSQGKSLKNLDTVRERYHRKEMERAESLASKYEKVKEFLSEIREDSEDTSTVLGTFFRGWKKGVDNLVLRGRLPQASEQIKRLGLDLNEIGWRDALNAASGFGKQLAEQAPLVWKYYKASQKLDDEMVSLAARYNITDEEARRLGDTIVKLTKIDMADGTDEVIKLADQLQYLQTTAGLAADEGARYASERFQEMGTDLDEAGDELIQFTIQADMMREALKDTQFEGKAFSFAIREDFVRAMMEAHRQFTSQTTDLENVAAAYQYAARKAIEFGISSKGAGKFAKAFGNMVFKEDTSPETFLAGRRLSGQISQEIAKFKKEENLDVGYGGMKDEQKRAVEDRIARRMGIEGDMTAEMRAGIQESILARGEGLGNVDISNMLASTQGGIKARLDANKELFGNVGDTSALSRILESRGVTGLDTVQKRRFARMIQTGDTANVAKEIQKLSQEAEKRASDELGRTQDALTAVLSLKDPVQELFNIKNLLKVLVLNVDFIGGMLEKIPGLGGMFGRVREYTRGILGDQSGEERSAAEKNKKTLEKEQEGLVNRMKEAQEQYVSAESTGDRDQIKEVIDGLQRQLDTNVAGQIEAASTLQRISEGEALARGGEAEKAPAPEEQPGLLRRALQGATELSSPLGGLGSLANFKSLGALPSLSGLLGGENDQESFASGLATLSKAQITKQVSPEVATQRARTASLGPSPRGAMDAVGSGEASVGADGKAVIAMRVQITNMEEVVAKAQSDQNGINHFGIG